LKHVDMYTDGSCLGNPGPAAWCAILRYNGHERVVTGSTPETSTNNRAELMAAIDGLKALKEPCKVRIISDSQYLVKGVMEWGMIEKGLACACKNADLWAALCNAMLDHDVCFEWVRGHNGHPENERCNAIAEKMLFEIGA